MPKVVIQDGIILKRIVTIRIPNYLFKLEYSPYDHINCNVLIGCYITPYQEAIWYSFILVYALNLFFLIIYFMLCTMAEETRNYWATIFAI